MYKAIVQALLQDMITKDMDKAFIKDAIALVILSAHDAELIEDIDVIELSAQSGIPRASKYFTEFKLGLKK